MDDFSRHGRVHGENPLQYGYGHSVSSTIVKIPSLTSHIARCFATKVPMKADENGDYTWRPILDEMDKNGISIVKFRSSRGKPRVELLE
jgi:hypothetical protein